MHGVSLGHRAVKVGGLSLKNPSDLQAKSHREVLDVMCWASFSMVPDNGPFFCGGSPSPTPTPTPAASSDSSSDGTQSDLADELMQGFENGVVRKH